MFQGNAKTNKKNVEILLGVCVSVLNSIPLPTLLSKWQKVIK